jgi:3-methylcrotonyl-CoA carboxylase alpha subunit
LDGNVDTGLIAREIEYLTAIRAPSEGMLNAVLEVLAHGTSDACEIASARAQPSQAMSGFRLNRDPAMMARLSELSGETREFKIGPGIDPNFVWLVGDLAVVPELGHTFAFSQYRSRASVGAAAGDGAIIAPMPGKVTSVDVSAGDKVAKGQRLLTLEAMKMEHGLVAPFDGTVAELNAKPGAQVQVDAVLARIEKASSPA